MTCLCWLFDFVFGFDLGLWLFSYLTWCGGFVWRRLLVVRLFCLFVCGSGSLLCGCLVFCYLSIVDLVCYCLLKWIEFIARFWVIWLFYCLVFYWLMLLYVFCLLLFVDLFYVLGLGLVVVVGFILFVVLLSFRLLWVEMSCL